MAAPDLLSPAAAAETERRMFDRGQEWGWEEELERRRGWRPHHIREEELERREEERNRIQTERLRYMLNPEGQPEVVLKQHLCVLVDRHANVVKRAHFTARDRQHPVIIVLAPGGCCFCAEGLVADSAARHFVFFREDTGCLVYLEVLAAGHEREISAPQARPKRILDL